MKWAEFLYSFSFSLRHKSGQLNKVIHDLSRRRNLVTEMRIDVLGFNDLKNFYETNLDFVEPWKDYKGYMVCDKQTDYFIQEDMLFKGIQLCIPRGSIRENIMKEKHSGRLAGHFGIEKTIRLILDRYFWLQICKDVQKMVRSCRICQTTKETSQNLGLYSPFHVLDKSWEDISMDFVLGFLKIWRGNDSILVVVDIFSKMAHFIPFKKTSYGVWVDELFFKKEVRLHGQPKTIVSDRDTRFIGYLWRRLWKKVNTQLKFSSTFHLQTDGQTNLVNRSLGNLLRSLVRDKPTNQDLILAQAEFTYNNSMNMSIKKTHFEIITRMNPKETTKSRDLNLEMKRIVQAKEFLDSMKTLHEEKKMKFEDTNVGYIQRVDTKKSHKYFEVGDEVVIHLKKSRFLIGTYSKMKMKKFGPCKILRKFDNGNAFEVELLEEMDISPIFNILDVFEYFELDDELKNNLDYPKKKTYSIERILNS